MLCLVSDVNTDNTEFGLASGMFTKNIDKALIHCVLSVMSVQSDNTEFGLASGMVTKNIDKVIIHCVLSVMSRVYCGRQTT